MDLNCKYRYRYCGSLYLGFQENIDIPYSRKDLADIVEDSSVAIVMSLYMETAIKECSVQLRSWVFSFISIW